MKSASGMGRGLNGVGAGPCESVVGRHIGIATLGIDTAVSGHNYALATLGKYRRFDHDRSYVGYLSYGAVARRAPLVRMQYTPSAPMLTNRIYSPESGLAISA